MRKCHSTEEIFEFINYWDIERKNLPVATDGIVLKVNILKQQKKPAVYSKISTMAIAYKFQARKSIDTT
jgi:DNA ligase (NAD+)